MTSVSRHSSSLFRWQFQHHAICLCLRLLRYWSRHRPTHTFASRLHCTGHVPNTIQSACSQQCRPRCYLACVLKQLTAFLFLVPSWGFPCGPPPFCRVPSLALFAQFLARAWDSPRRLPCLSEMASESRRRMSRASAQTWKALNVNKICPPSSTGAKATSEFFNTLRVIGPPLILSRFSATCTDDCKQPETSCTLSCDPTFNFLTRRTRSPDFLP